MKKVYNSFLTSLGLICRIPIRLKYSIDFSLFPLFFPLIGIITSAMVLGLFYIFNPLFYSSGLTVFILISLQYIVFNLFHFDGLLDCADAFLYNTTKTKRLSILTDKRTGAFAVFAGTIYLAAKFYFLNESVIIINNSNSTWIWLIILFSYPLSGRIAGSIMPAILPPAEDPGLAELLQNYSKVLVSLGIILSISIPLFLTLGIDHNTSSPVLLLIPFSGAFGAGILVSILSKRAVGGYTGDSIGLTIEIGELLHLMIFAEVLRRLF